MPDFWLIAAYLELDVKGNLFNGRKLLLQSLRNNENSSLLHVEYFKYEVKVHHKINERRQVLTSGGRDRDELEFVDGENAKEDEGMFDTSDTLVRIVFDNLVKKFPENVRVFKACWEDIIEPTEHISEEFKQIVKNAYS